MHKPLIGITAMHVAGSQLISHCTKTEYIDAIRQAGGQAVLIPSGDDASGCEGIMTVLDGLLLPGGADVSPLLYGEQPIKEVTFSRISDDRFEAALINAAIAQHKPILGICRGMQMLNVALGGTLYQDIHVQNAATLCHRQDPSIRAEGTHSVTLVEGTHLKSIINSTTTLVNSYHHQAVKELGNGLRVSAAADDGVVEAFESADGMVMGVQWHPEGMTIQMQFAEMFRDFVQRCSKPA